MYKELLAEWSPPKTDTSSDLCNINTLWRGQDHNPVPPNFPALRTEHVSEWLLWYLLEQDTTLPYDETFSFALAHSDLKCLKATYSCHKLTRKIGHHFLKCMYVCLTFFLTSLHEILPK